MLEIGFKGELSIALKMKGDDAVRDYTLKPYDNNWGGHTSFVLVKESGEDQIDVPEGIFNCDDCQLKVARNFDIARQYGDDTEGIDWEDYTLTIMM